MPRRPPSFEKQSLTPDEKQIAAIGVAAATPNSEQQTILKSAGGRLAEVAGYLASRELEPPN